MSGADTTQRPRRWGGKLTGRALPDEDPSIDALSPAQREEVSAHWLERGASERRVGEAFAVIHQTLVEASADPALVNLAARAVDDEDRHAELSRVVASRYAGRELPNPPPLKLSVPVHQGATPTLRRTLWVMGQCVLNETFASCVLESSLRVTTAPLARAALRELLSDEIDHARIGWAYMKTLDAKTQPQVEPWLLELVMANVQSWRTTPRLYPSDPALLQHGAISLELIEDSLRVAIRELVVPGFKELGLPTQAITDWLEAQSAGRAASTAA